MRNLELIKRNTAEIITEEELENLLRERKELITYCGYEVSGPVHIGTLVAIQKQIDFQNSGLKVKVLLADLHTYLNRKGSEEWIDEMVEYWKSSLIALGLKNAEFIRGTDFSTQRGLYPRCSKSWSINNTEKGIEEYAGNCKRL